MERNGQMEDIEREIKTKRQEEREGERERGRKAERESERERDMSLNLALGSNIPGWSPSLGLQILLRARLVMNAFN